mgnify:FL=1
MYITYSQPKLKKDWNERIRRLWSIITTRSTPDLWIKVFILRNKKYKLSDGKEHEFLTDSVNGHYRCATVNGHGFYDSEWDYLREHKKINHCITLKIGENCDDERIARLMIHEYRHYLQWKKYGANSMRQKVNGKRKRPIQVERDAKKYTEKRINELIGNRLIKYKSIEWSGMYHANVRYAMENWFEEVR